MEATLNTNKEVIRNFYEVFLNNRKFDLIDSIVSEKYSNALGETGIEGFKKGITEVIRAFPDARWTLTEIIAEGAKVFVKQRVEGTHQAMFQNIAPTNRIISNDGYALYEFEGGKIIRHQIQTDRFAFLQQLGVLPSASASLSGTSSLHVFFIDKFSVPNKAIEHFTHRLKQNQEYIKTLPGFVRQEAIAANDADGNLTLMTIAVWESEDFLDEAKRLVQVEYQRTGFDPAEFMQQLNIKMERVQYRVLKNEEYPLTSIR